MIGGSRGKAELTSAGLYKDIYRLYRLYKRYIGIFRVYRLVTGYFQAVCGCLEARYGRFGWFRGHSRSGGARRR